METEGFFKFEILINVLVSSFWFIWISMLWVYGQYRVFILSARRLSLYVRIRRWNLFVQTIETKGFFQFKIIINILLHFIICVMGLLPLYSFNFSVRGTTIDVRIWRLKTSDLDVRFWCLKTVPALKWLHHLCPGDRFEMCAHQTNITPWTNVGTMLGYHLRWWPNIEPAFGQRVEMCSLLPTARGHNDKQAGWNRK